MTARTLMVQGTCSSAGKSLMTAALCRIFRRKGLRVAPFKAQNMSNNAAVCRDGGEIGRSQALQALACGIEPTVEMNPVLLKPEADSRSQVIVNGRPWKNLDARTYFERSQILWSEITTALDFLREKHDLVIMEGAGSPAELNLQEVDLVNMRVAHYANAPVLLVGNIELGGIFAQLLGTHGLLSAADQELIQGFLVNKFRGDQSLFDEGVKILEEKSGIPVWGVVPWIPDLNLPEEDAGPVAETRRSSAPEGQLDVAVIYFPRISNLDDVDALRSEPNVSIRFVKSVRQLGSPAAILLPGTKSTIDDFNWLRETGLAETISTFAVQGTEIIGLCGGYQMLGERIHNPHSLETHVRDSSGLGLLPITTVFHTDKATRQSSATINSNTPVADAVGLTVTGYEIHQGQSETTNGWLEIDSNGQICGSSNQEQNVWGCYLHGLFHNDAFRSAWIRKMSKRNDVELAETEYSSSSFADLTERELDRLADVVETSIGAERLLQVIGFSVEAAP